MWFNPAEILSYNMIWNFVIGVRGGGKTFNTMDMLCNRFNKHGDRWIYARKTEAELKRAKTDLFGDLIYHGKHSDCDLKTQGDTMYMNGEVMGRTLAISTADQYKGTGFPGTKFILVDEFLSEKGTHKVQDLVKKTVGLVESAGRMRDCRVILLANSLSVDNEFFDFFNVRPNRGATFTKNPEKSAIVQMWAGGEYLAAKKNTKFARSIEDSAISEYMYDNSFLLDNYNFIEPMTGNGNYQCTIYYKGVNYGVYWQKNKGIYHVNKKYSPSCRMVFTFSTDDHKPNYIMFKSGKNNPYIKRLMYAHDMGLVRFDDITTKNVMYDVFQYL